MMAPLPNNEHQQLVGRLTSILQQVVGWSANVYVLPGANVSDRGEPWEQNYRCPDIAVFLAGTRARNLSTHWLGGPDFAVEITSDQDRSREKIPFYASVQVQELLIVDRDPWRLELFRLTGTGLVSVGVADEQSATALASEVVPLKFRVLPDLPRPSVQVIHGETTWLV
jgi:Uma2 family endonuclease